MAEPSVRPVMVLVAGMDDYHIQVISGIRRVLHPLGINLLVVVLDTFDEVTTPDVVLDLVRREVPQGAIALADAAVFRCPDLAATLTEVGTPLVSLATRVGEAPRVRGDNVTGMRSLMRHLLDERHVRRPALVRGIPDFVDSQVREQVFREECAARGVDVDEDLVVDGMFHAKPAHDAVFALLQRRRDFDAVVALNDPSALGALSALTAGGLAVPDDVLLTGFDDIRDSAIAWPPLTTVAQDLPQQGSRAAELLLALLAGRPCPDDVQLPSRLVVRTSTSDCAPALQEAVRSARALQSGMTTQELAVQFSWRMANCRTLDDVHRVLGPWLAQGGVSRCFVGLDQWAAGSCGEGADRPDRPTRLAMCYRHGEAEPVTDEVFPRHELLPARLRSELTAGDLLLQPLSIEGRERGYLLHGFDVGRHVVLESLRIELPRTVDMVFSSHELKDRAAMLERLVALRTQELEQANARLQQSALQDDLTGIANRRAFREFLDRLRDDAAAPDGPVALLMIDIDMFKAFNDRYGHVAGDRALRSVAGCLERAVRDGQDLACRYGGEEFAAVLPECDLTAALATAHRFAGLLAAAALEHAASAVATVVTASVGVALTNRADAAFADLVAAADDALYEAKTQGRNRIVVARTAAAVPHQGTRRVDA